VTKKGFVMRKIVFAGVLFLSVLLYLGMDCQESLPPRSNPGVVYSLSLEVDWSPNPMNIELDINKVLEGRQSLPFPLYLTNTFDETLADTVLRTAGEFTAWWTVDPEVRITIPVHRWDELFTQEIDGVGNITLDPGDSVHFNVVWPAFQDDDGISVWLHVNSHTEGDVLVYDPMTFEAQAHMQLFPQTSVVYSDIVRFRLCFHRIKE
jgi:hypothetical protein